MGIVWEAYHKGVPCPWGSLKIPLNMRRMDVWKIYLPWHGFLGIVFHRRYIFIHGSVSSQSFVCFWGV